MGSNKLAKAERMRKALLPKLMKNNARAFSNTCVPEMTGFLQCLKGNSFDMDKCQDAAQALTLCSQKVEAAEAAKSKQKSTTNYHMNRLLRERHE